MSSNHTGDGLRAMLFAQLEALTNPAQAVDLKRAQLVNETAQVIVNSAKVEVDYVRAIGGCIMLPWVEAQEGVAERPSAPAPAPAALPATGGEAPLTAAETQRALGFGGNAGHPWRRDAERDWQRRQDKQQATN